MKIYINLAVVLNITTPKFSSGRKHIVYNVVFFNMQWIEIDIHLTKVKSTE